MSEEHWILSREVPSAVIEEKVIAAVAEALDLEPEEVELDARMQDELGAESLDHLDIAFQLERELKIRLPRANLLERARDHFGDDSLVAEGRITPLGVELLRRGMPELDPETVRPDTKASEVAGLFTVRTYVRLVHRLLASKEEMSRVCESCGGRLEDSPVLPELVCVDCRTPVSLPTGDEVIFRDIVALAELDSVANEDDS